MLNVIQMVCNGIAIVCFSIIVLYYVLYSFCIVSDWFYGRK